jgi:hypothetical protein
VNPQYGIGEVKKFETYFFTVISSLEFIVFLLIITISMKPKDLDGPNYQDKVKSMAKIWFVLVVLILNIVPLLTLIGLIVYALINTDSDRGTPIVTLVNITLCFVQIVVALFIDSKIGAGLFGLTRTGNLPKKGKDPSPVIIGDPGRQLVLREDIYCLSYVLCLKHEKLIELMDDPEQRQCIPMDANESEVFLTAVFSFVSSTFISILLVQYFVG